MPNNETTLTPSTYFGLLAEFGTPHIPAHLFAKKYMGLGERVAKERAAQNKLVVPVFRSGGQKTPLFVDAVDVADYLDKVKEKSKKEFNLAKQ